MISLPNATHWTSATIEELVEHGRVIGYGVLKPGPHVADGIRLIKSHQVRDGTMDLAEDYRISHELSEEFKRTKLRGGELLLNVVGSIGRSAIAPPELADANVSRAIAVLPLKKEWVKWIQLFLSSPIAQAEMFGRKVGIAQPVLNLGQVRKLAIPLPPVSEQRRIVAEIEKQFTRLDAGVAALRRTQANLKRYRAAVLKAACEGRLVPAEAELVKQQPSKRGSISRTSKTPDFESGAMLLERSLAERRKAWIRRGIYESPVAPNTSNLPALPEGWTWASIDQLTADSMIGLDRGRAQQSENPEVGVPYIKMNNVTMDGRVLFDDVMFVPASKEESTRFAVREGDILFNTRNSNELVGKVGLVRSPPVGAVYNNNLMRIRVSSSVIPAFMSVQMCSHGFRQRMELVKKATTNIAAVYGKDLWPLPIALPPLAEQTRIVAEVERRLSVVEELETVVNANLQRATRLRQSILSRAFISNS